MFYNYFKIILLNLKPRANQSAELVKNLRNISQQSHAFTRELSMNLLENKRELKDMIPGMKIDPFENIGLKTEAPLKMDEKSKTFILNI